MKKVQSKNLRLSDDARRVAWMFEDGACLDLLSVLDTLRHEIGEVQDLVERCIRAVVELIEKKLARLIRRSPCGMEQSWPEEYAAEMNLKHALHSYFEPEILGGKTRVENRSEVELRIDQSKRTLIYGTGISKD